MLYDWPKLTHYRWLKVTLVLFWLVGWGVGETLMVAGLFGQPMDWKGPPRLDWTFYIVLSFWTVAGPVAFWWLLKLLRRQAD